MAEVNVKGLRELQALLDTLPAKVEANVMRGALRAGMKVVEAEAEKNVPVATGALYAGLKIGTRRRGSVVTANVKATGIHGPVAHLIEFGTRAHQIRPKTKEALSFNGNFGEVVNHPGVAPRPFMRPALDSKANAAVSAAAEYMKRRLATKHGLDTAHIRVEGDE
jgi:HK97 gp10 family phage protein